MMNTFRRAPILLSYLLVLSSHTNAFTPESSLPRIQIREQTKVNPTNKKNLSPLATKSPRVVTDDIEESSEIDNNIISHSRRGFLLSSASGSTALIASILTSGAMSSYADVVVEQATAVVVQVNPPSPDIKKIFNEARGYEFQGNVPAANRLYSKVTKLAPGFIYGWSNLGNTQVVLGNLEDGEVSYTKSIDLCSINRKETEGIFGVPKCDDLYLLYLNRGCLRMNMKTTDETNNRRKQLLNALQDIEIAAELRSKPDAIVLQNRARARELNQMFDRADRDYVTAISMTGNEVAPFWLRASMVKFQLGDQIGSLDLLRRVQVKFPEAPEVKAALASILYKKGDKEGAKKTLLSIPEAQRVKFGDPSYLENVVNWPPAMVDTILEVSKEI